MSVGTQTVASLEGRVDIDPAETLPLKGSSILIVDEDPAFQLGLKTFLKEYVGFSQTFTARNGREALQRLAEEPSISMVTLDYKMPEVDGIQFLQRLKEQLPHPLGVIMITGYPSDELEETFRSFDSPHLRTLEFLAKPVEFTELETIIHRSWEGVQQTTDPEKVTMDSVLEVSRKPSEPEPSGETPALEVSSEASATETTSEGPVLEVSREIPIPIPAPSSRVASPLADSEQPASPPAEETASPIPIGFCDLVDQQLTIIDQKVDKIGKSVENLDRRVPSRTNRFFSGMFKLLIAAGLFWAAAHLGWLDKASEFLKKPSLGEITPSEKETTPASEEKPIPTDDNEVL